jgi:hypothetical protein
MVNTAKPMSSKKLRENAIRPPYYLGLDTATMITITIIINTNPAIPSNIIDISAP